MNRNINKCKKKTKEKAQNHTTFGGLATNNNSKHTHSTQYVLGTVSTVLHLLTLILTVALQVSAVKNPLAMQETGDSGSITGSGRYPRGGHGNPLQYSCLESPKDREAWRAAVHGVAKSQTPQK